MLIVDAQIHIWRSGSVVVPPHRSAPYPAEEAIADMDAAGVDGAVLHPPSWDAQAIGQSVEAVRQWPDRFCILARIPVDDPDGPTRAQSWKAQPGMMGLRYALIEPHMRNWLVDGTMDWVWPAAEQAGLVVALLAGDMLPVVGRIAERHPGLRLIVDHLGVVRGRKGDAAFANMADLVKLARYPNIAVKATGCPQYATDAYPFRSLSPHYRAVFDAFGPSRMFWGTDITRQPCSWRQCVTHFTEELPWLSGNDLELVMGRAVCDWLGWHPRKTIAAARS